MGVLGFLGPLLAYGDVWLNRLAPWLLVLSLGAAGTIWRAPHGRPRRGVALCAAVALAALLALFALGRFNTADAENMFQITAGLVEDGVPWMHQDHTWIKFGLGQPLLTVPLYLLGRAWAGAAHADTGQVTRFCVALLNAARHSGDGAGALPRRPAPL